MTPLTGVAKPMPKRWTKPSTMLHNDVFGKIVECHKCVAQMGNAFDLPQPQMSMSNPQ
jgi:hypothetical protein